MHVNAGNLRYQNDKKEIKLRDSKLKLSNEINEWQRLTPIISDGC